MWAGRGQERVREGREGAGAQPLCRGGSMAKGKPSRSGEIPKENDFSSSCMSSQGTGFAPAWLTGLGARELPEQSQGR